MIEAESEMVSVFQKIMCVLVGQHVWRQFLRLLIKGARYRLMYLSANLSAYVDEEKGKIRNIYGCLEFLICNPVEDKSGM